jgi:hypothetical protein
MDRRTFKLKLPATSTPIFLLVLSLAAFGLLITYLGFYWDDWPAAWYYHLFGSRGFLDVFSIDRPFLGWLYQLTTPLMGSSPLRWQVFAVLTRWLCASVFWFAIWSIWPKRGWAAAATALLFLVYPGFSQQPIAITYSHAWLLMAAFFGSLIAMIWAVRKPRWFWPLSILGWLLAAVTHFTVEYFFGLELIRPAVLWIVLADQIPESRQRIKRVFVNWLPYLLILAVFLYWRVFLTETPRGQVTLFSALAGNPLGALLSLLETIFLDITETSLNAWGQITQFRNWFGASEISGLAPIVLVLAAGAVCGIFLWFLQPGSLTAGEAEEQPADNPAKPWGWQAAGLGLLALLLGGIPFWVTDLPIELRFPWDRFTLAMMFGASLLTSGVIFLVTGSRKAQVILISVMVAMAAGLHYLNTDAYQRRWAVQKDFFWQLTWRAPQITPGTLLLTDSWPFDRYTDNSLAAPLNWTYDPDSRSADMQYMIYDISTRLGLTLPSLEAGQVVREDYRATAFEGTTDQAIVFFFDPPACLRIINPETDQNYNRYPNTLYEAMSLARLDLIETDPEKPATPPVSIFGAEPFHDWCYYYEQADRAVQVQDYEYASTLGDEAFEKGMFPRNPYEYFPFIEANANTGRWNKATNMTQNTLTMAHTTRVALCVLWQEIARTAPDSAEKNTSVQGAIELLGCSQP